MTASPASSEDPIEAFAREQGWLPEGPADYTPKLADHIWNRACREPEPSATQADRELYAAIAFDGLTNNGGLHHAAEAIGPDLELALAGYTRFGLTDHIALIRRVLPPGDLSDTTDDDAADAAELTANQLFGELDKASSLSDAFAAYHAQHPEAFAPIEP